MHKNQVDNTRRLRESRKAAGIKQVTVYCPTERVEELKALVAQWREK